MTLQYRIDYHARIYGWTAAEAEQKYNELVVLTDEYLMLEGWEKREVGIDHKWWGTNKYAFFKNGMQLRYVSFGATGESQVGYFFDYRIDPENYNKAPEGLYYTEDYRRLFQSYGV